MKLTILSTIALSLLFSFNSIFAFAPDTTARTVVAANKPPGLQRHNMSPRGLQNKTPYGWSQGKKTGWNKATKAKSKKHSKRWHNKNRMNHWHRQPVNTIR